MTKAKEFDSFRVVGGSGTNSVGFGPRVITPEDVCSWRFLYELGYYTEAIANDHEIRYASDMLGRG